jgi:outer membrane protein assembly factor BamB
VGDGVATPALVGDERFVFSCESGKEVIRCLNVVNGKEIWRKKYDTKGMRGSVSGHHSHIKGAISSSAGAGGKVVTLNVHGALCCWEARIGEQLWRNDDFKNPASPNTSSSPVVVEGVCIVQPGGDDSGAIVVLELSSGKEKWKAAVSCRP